MSSVYTCVMGEGEGKKTQHENSVKHVQIHCSQQGKTIASSPVSNDLACVQITVSEKSIQNCLQHGFPLLFLC